VEAEGAAVASPQLEVGVGFAVTGENEGGGYVVLRLELYPQLDIGLSCESGWGMEVVAAAEDEKAP